MEKLTLTQVKALIRKGSKADIRLVPSKMNPNSIWNVGHTTNLEGHTLESFEKVVNAFSYYNCNKEQGLRVHYYKM